MKKNLFVLGLSILTGLSLYAQTPRMCLYEEFTGETCPPCAATNPGLNAILLSPLNATKVIPLKWQVPIPSAPTPTWSLYKTNKSEIDWRYRSVGAGGYGYISQNTAVTATNSGINSAPQGVMDGQHQWVFGAASDHPANINNNVIATAQSYTSAFSISMVHEWDITMTAVVVTVNIAASANFTAVGPLVFRCVMVERLIQFSVQPGTNGEKVFEDVVIKSYPTLQGGTTMNGSWTTGQTQNFVLTCSVPSYIRDIKQISMVGFIQDDGNRKVAQATRSKANNDAVAVTTVIEPVCAANTSPVISVSNAGISPITNMTITPTVDGSVGPVTNWSGNLAPGATTTLLLNSFSTPAGAGPHSFSYTITAMNGIDFNMTNNVNLTSFVVANSSAGYQVAESFSSTAFPPSSWTAVNGNSGIGWVRSTATGGYFQQPYQCTKYDFFSNKVLGDVDELFLPPTDLQGADAVQMTFDYAYAPSSSTSTDRLEVLVSKDCGATWTTVFDKAGAALATAPDQFGTAYVPDPAEFSQWQTPILSLPGFNQAAVLCKFRVTNGNGNNLYIDNVNLRQPSPSGLTGQTKTANSLAVFPNPSNGQVSLQFTMQKAGSASVSVINTLGQQLFATEKYLSAGEQTISLDMQGYAEGIYSVVVECDGMSTTKKVTLLK